MSERRDYFIILIGDQYTGKTSWRIRYLQGNYNSDTVPTIGTDMGMKIEMLDGIRIAVKIWDLSGNNAYSKTRAIYYQGVHAIILFVDVNKIDTFRSLPNWLEEIKQQTEGKIPPLMLIGNRIDEGRRAISYDDGSKYASQLSDWLQLKVPYFETSAKTGIHITQAMETLLSNMNFIYQTGKVRVKQIVEDIPVPSGM